MAEHHLTYMLDWAEHLQLLLSTLIIRNSIVL
jgi:hypothetical protein